MRELASVLPRKVQEVPGVLQGGIGWQGIVPARAAKMGSIAVDKAIAKLGTPSDFYQQLEPDRIAEHIVTVFRPEIPQLVDEVMRQEYPRLWRDCPIRSGGRLPAGAGPAAVGRRPGHRRDRRSTSTSCSTRRSW